MRYFINEKEKNAMQLLRKEHETLKLRTEELRVANSKLQYFAKHDALTELSNRHHLHDQLNQMMAYAKRHNLMLALMFIDLDGFKKVNDTCGHAVGDEVLREVAQRIKSLLREEDLIARLGGDEFAVGILSSYDITYIKDIARRLIEEIRREYSDLTTETPPISASIGISLFPEHTKNIDELLKYADEAMYYVKNSSKNSFFIRQTVD
jgi:diguanylate cyclase (GGDEF)-like protein